MTYNQPRIPWKMAQRIEACWLQEIVTAIAEPRLIPADVVVVLVALIGLPREAFPLLRSDLSVNSQPAGPSGQIPSYLALNTTAAGKTGS